MTPSSCASRASQRPMPLSLTERRYVDAVYAALCKTYGQRLGRGLRLGHQPHDLAGFAIERVLGAVSHFMQRYPSAQHCANAIAKSAHVDYWRRELAQRGHGARGTRSVIGDEPIDHDDLGAGTVLDQQHGNLPGVDEWLDHDQRRALLDELEGEVSDLAWAGFVLVNVHGLTQGQAAARLGVTREYLNREMSKARKRVAERETRHSAAAANHYAAAPAQHDDTTTSRPNSEATK